MLAEQREVAPRFRHDAPHPKHSVQPHLHTGVMPVEFSVHFLKGDIAAVVISARSRKIVRETVTGLERVTQAREVLANARPKASL